MTDIRKIHRTEVRALDGGIIRSDEKLFKREQLDVLGENEHALVINDTFFTTLRKSKKDTFYSVLNVPSIQVYTSDRVWGTGVAYTLFSTSKPRAETVRAQIEAAVDSKIGFFVRRMDLAFITDQGGEA